MKKSSFVAMMLGTVSGVLFSLGMCMALLTEWNAFVPGVILGVTGLILGIITLVIWRKMEHKAPIKINGRAFLLTMYSVIGLIVLGVGMCLCIVWSQFVIGTLVGLLGILMLLSLIPIVKGIK